MIGTLESVLGNIIDLEPPPKESDGSFHGDGFVSGYLVGWIECKNTILDLLKAGIEDALKTRSLVNSASLLKERKR